LSDSERDACLAVWYARESKRCCLPAIRSMKPLYYTSRGMAGGVVFASEIKAFLSLRFSAEMDSNSLRAVSPSS
jgi:hypothetical protein